MAVSIYALYDEESILYVGSTKNVTKRFQQHRWKQNKTTALAKYNGNIQSVKIIVLEEVSDELRYATEGFYIEWLSPTLNKCKTGITQNESDLLYYYRNRETRLHYMRQLYQSKK